AALHRAEERFPGEIKLLLGVAQTPAQFAEQCLFRNGSEPCASALEKISPAFAQTIFQLANAALEIAHIGHGQLGRRAWRRRAQVGDEIRDREINFVAHRRDHWDRGMEKRSGYDLFVELPKVFDAASAARTDEKRVAFLA